MKQKYNKIFSEREINKYLNSISSLTGGQSKKVDAAWRKLGYINASAYKGYGILSDKYAAYNFRVYLAKEQAIISLAPHTDNIVASNGVLYIRTLDGIQLSFHLGSTHRNCSYALKKIHWQYQGEAKWDGVQDSYTYTDIEAYNSARAEYQKKVLEDNERRQKNIIAFQERIHQFFSHHSTRRIYGLPTKKKDWEEYCKNKDALLYETWSREKLGYNANLQLQIYLGNPSSPNTKTTYDEMVKIQSCIEAKMYEGWNNFNFNPYNFSK